MKICILDGNVILNKDILHEMLMEQLELPDWYGKNLDALHDCLTDMTEDTEIVIFHEEALFDHLERYGRLFINVLKDAEEENTHIKWKIAE